MRSQEDPTFFSARAAADLLRTIRRSQRDGCGFVLLAGPSGCGKSSLLRAPVVPSLTGPAGDDRLRAVFSSVIVAGEIARARGDESRALGHWRAAFAELRPRALRGADPRVLDPYVRVCLLLGHADAASPSLERLRATVIAHRVRVVRPHPTEGTLSTMNEIEVTPTIAETLAGFGNDRGRKYNYVFDPSRVHVTERDTRIVYRLSGCDLKRLRMADIDTTDMENPFGKPHVIDDGAAVTITRANKVKRLTELLVMLTVDPGSDEPATLGLDPQVTNDPPPG